MGFWTVFAIAVGLSMDAFAVSVANGCRIKQVTLRDAHFNFTGIGGLVNELGIQADFSMRPSLYLAGDRLDAAGLREERRLREAMGIETRFLDAGELARRGFVGEGAQMKDGTAIKADLVVLATGYKGQEVLVRKLFGDRMAERVGPIWGFGEDQELRNMFTRTPQPGLWFSAGSLAQCRIYSRALSLQIKALEAGVLREPAASD